MAGSEVTDIAAPHVTELAPLIVLLPMIAFAVCKQVTTQSSTGSPLVSGTALQPA